MRATLFFVLPLLALAACTPAEDAPADDAATEARSEAPADATIDLGAGGITIPAQNGFEQLAAPFGSARAATEATLANVVGAATGGHDGTGDCWLKTTEYAGLTLSFNEADEFVGYYATPPWSGTGQRADMLANDEITMVEDSTLGEEFTIGEGEAIISGLFTGTGDDATVEALWAGENCIFR